MVVFGGDAVEVLLAYRRRVFDVGLIFSSLSTFEGEVVGGDNRKSSPNSYLELFEKLSRRVRTGTPKNLQLREM